MSADIDTKSLRDLLSRATAGEWSTQADLPYGEAPRIHADGRLIADFGNAEPAHLRQDFWEADALLTAAAKNSMAALLDIAEAAQAARERFDARRLADKIEAYAAGIGKCDVHDFAQAAQLIRLISADAPKE